MSGRGPCAVRLDFAQYFVDKSQLVVPKSTVMPQINRRAHGLAKA